MRSREQKILITLSIAILVGMAVCACFEFFLSPHTRGWRLGFLGLLLANSLLQLWRVRNMPVPDNITRLFSKPTPRTLERP